jgi:hypothetical protein
VTTPTTSVHDAQAPSEAWTCGARPRFVGWTDDIDGPQQKDNLCGPFWGARVLRRAGITTYAGEQIDQDLVASMAGTLLPEEDGNWTPIGTPKRRDYTRPLPYGPAREAGTTPAALAKALEQLSGNALEVMPITGRFDSATIEQLMIGAEAHGLWIIANVQTGLLWGSRPDADVIIAELLGEPQPGPPPDWDVGHFIELQLLVRGQAGSLVLVGDSYPSLGWQGRHLQPPRLIARALEREDGREGGILVIGAHGHPEALSGLAEQHALEVRFWDNGSKSAAFEGDQGKTMRSGT